MVRNPELYNVPFHLRLTSSTPAPPRNRGAGGVLTCRTGPDVQHAHDLADAFLVVLEAKGRSHVAMERADGHKTRRERPFSLESGGSSGYDDGLTL